jgi:hypothetical protein
MFKIISKKEYQEFVENLEKQKVFENLTKSLEEKNKLLEKEIENLKSPIKKAEEKQKIAEAEKSTAAAEYQKMIFEKQQNVMRGQPDSAAFVGVSFEKNNAKIAAEKGENKVSWEI